MVRPWYGAVSEQARWNVVSQGGLARRGALIFGGVLEGDFSKMLVASCNFAERYPS